MSQSAVVRVFATVQESDHASPWQSLAPTGGSGSGVVVAPNRVLTGAHVVADATFLQVQKISTPDKFIARVHGICHDADLALLEVEDRHFMDDVEPAARGELPHFQDRVAVVGFPVGGDEISITEGVVSRIEVQRYAHSQRNMLAVTVDAAINEGNSGGPVLSENGDVIGIAFQGLEDAENIGEMVPAPVIERFLLGVEQQKPLEVPGLGVQSQNLENPVLRRVLGMAEGQCGVLIEAVDFDSTVSGAIEVGDVLLGIDGHDIANNGTIRYQKRYRTGYDAVLGEAFVGQQMAFTILRAGKQHDVSCELRPHRPLVSLHSFDSSPPWFVFGGLVFQALTRDWLRTWGERWWEKAPQELMHLFHSGVRSEERQEVVVLSQVLADEINVGYAPFMNEVITSVNGVQPAHLADFVRQVDACNGVLDLRTSLGGRMVLDADAAREAGPRILERYRVPKDRAAP